LGFTSAGPGGGRRGEGRSFKSQAGRRRHSGTSRKKQARAAGLGKGVPRTRERRGGRNGKPEGGKASRISSITENAALNAEHAQTRLASVWGMKSRKERKGVALKWPASKNSLSGPDRGALSENHRAQRSACPLLEIGGSR